MLSRVSPALIKICPQPDGGGHDAGGVNVMVSVEVTVGVGDSSPGVGVSVGGRVWVAVCGGGEGNEFSAVVGVTCGTNSTSEMDSAPIISPIEIKATTSALPNSRRFCISSFLWLWASYFRHRRGVTTR